MKKLTILTVILITTMSFAQVPNYVPTNGLVGWWPFNGNANDESGNGNNGTVNGATLTSDRNGVANSAYAFNTSKITCPIVNLNSSAGFTVSTWFKLLSSSTQMLLSIGPDNTSNTFRVMYHQGNLRGAINSFTTLEQIEIPHGFSNIYEHVVYVVSATSMKIYKNGVLINTLFGSFNSNPNDFLYFGYHDHINWPYYLEGSLDDIGIWNRSLTDCEIKDLYYSQLGYTTINAGQNQTICKGDSTILHGAGGIFLSWNNGVFDSIPFSPQQTSSYVLTGGDNFGCVGTDTVEVIVLEPSSSSQIQTALDTYTWPVNNQTYTQSGTYVDTLVNAAGCDSIVTLNLTLSFTGINELTTSTLSISPNPTAGDFTIAGLELYNNISSMRVLDVNGKLVKELDPTASKFTLGTAKPGVYFVTITAGNKQEVIKLIRD